MSEATSVNPEWAVCLAARNDYYAGNIMDDSMDEVMEGITDLSGEPMPDASRLEKKRMLIRKLLKQEHYGPFEHPQIMFHVENMSRVTMAQITRHRHMSFDIQSMRYVNFADADIAIPKSLTDPEHNTRSDGLVWYDMSSDVAIEDQDPDVESMNRAYEIYVEDVEESVERYHELLDLGVPREDARYLLPLGTQVNVTFSGNLRTMLHVANMRSKGSAQWEIQELTEKVGQELDDWAPYTMEYFEENGPFKLGM